MTSTSTIKKCSNTLHNCQGFVTQRGNILCDQCIEERKNTIAQRRDMNIEELLEKNRALSVEIVQCRLENQKKTEEMQQLQERFEQLKQKLESSNGQHELVVTVELEQLKQSVIHYTKENERFGEMIERYRKENEELVKSKAEYEMNYEQLKLDLNQLTVENAQIKTANKLLSDQNADLARENGKLFLE